MRHWKKNSRQYSWKKNEFENRDESRLSAYKIFWRFQLHDSNAGSELIVLLPKNPTKVKIFLLRSLVEWFKLVVMELHEFEWRNFSLLGVFFGIFGLSEFRHKERIQEK